MTGRRENPARPGQMLGWAAQRQSRRPVVRCLRGDRQGKHAACQTKDEARGRIERQRAVVVETGVSPSTTGSQACKPSAKSRPHAHALVQISATGYTAYYVQLFSSCPVQTLMVLTELRNIAQTTPILLLFSGGFDSSCVAALLAANGNPVTLLSINYSTIPPSEVKAREQIASLLDQPLLVVNTNLSDRRFNSDQTDDYFFEAWMPYRNMIFLAIAASIAVDKNLEYVASGHRSWDGNIFNDSTAAFFSSFDCLLKYSGRAASKGVKLIMPLLKSDDVLFDFISNEPSSLELLKQSWSCWRGGVDPCGQCRPCVFRDAFLKKLISGGRDFVSPTF